MEAKLTLRLDEAVISRAKKFAAQNQTSLSDLVEAYFRRVTSPAREDSDIDPLVKELTGIAKAPRGRNYRRQIAKYLLQKHG